MRLILDLVVNHSTKVLSWRRRLGRDHAWIVINMTASSVDWTLPQGALWFATHPRAEVGRPTRLRPLEGVIIGWRDELPSS